MSLICLVYVIDSYCQWATCLHFKFKSNTTSLTIETQNRRTSYLLSATFEFHNIVVKINFDCLLQLWNEWKYFLLEHEISTNLELLQYVLLKFTISTKLLEKFLKTLSHSELMRFRQIFTSFSSLVGVYQIFFIFNNMFTCM